MKIEHASAPHLAKGVKAITQTQIPTYEVGMPEDEEAAFAAQMSQAERAFANQPATGIPSLADDPLIQQEVAKKSTLEKLMFFSQEHIKEVVLGGVTFKIKLLNSNDQVYIVKLMRDYAAKEGYKLSFMTLAAAIVSVNDLPLEDFYDGELNIEDPVIRKYYQVNKWNSPVTTLLMDAYNKFQKEIEQEYSKDFLVK